MSRESDRSLDAFALVIILVAVGVLIALTPHHLWCYLLDAILLAIITEVLVNPRA